MTAFSHKEFYLRYGFDPEYRYTDGQGHLLTKSQALYNCRKKFIKGDLVEVMICSAPIFNGDGLEPLKQERSPARRAGSPDPANIARARRRAVKKLNDLIVCNDWSYFVTVTLDGDKVDRGDYDTVIKKVNTYLDNRVRRHGWKYVGVVEYHKNKKGIHFHFLVDGDLSLVDSGCVLIPHHKRPVRISTAKKKGVPPELWKTVYNLTDWSLGFSTAIAVYGDRKALANYVGKYLTKSECNKIGGRWFYHGGALLTPDYTYENVDFDSIELYDTLIDSDGGYFKILYT